MNNPMSLSAPSEESTVSGRVVAGDDGRLFVDVPRRSACQSCGKESGCGMSVLGALSVSQSLRLELQDISVVAGQSVRLSCPQDGLLKAALMAYAPPALGVVMGAVAMALNGFGDGAQVLGALTGLALGLMTTRMLATRSALPKMNILKE